MVNVFLVQQPLITAAVIPTVAKLAKRWNSSDPLLWSSRHNLMNDLSYQAGDLCDHKVDHGKGEIGEEENGGDSLQPCPRQSRETCVRCRR